MIDPLLFQGHIVHETVEDSDDNDTDNRFEVPLDIGTEALNCKWILIALLRH